MFYMPRVVWRILNKKSGIAVTTITGEPLLPVGREEREEREEGRGLEGREEGREWVSLLLCCQAIMFYMPCVVWRILNKKSGIAVTTITSLPLENRQNLIH